MKRKLLSLLVLLMTATGAWAGTETIATNQWQGSYTGTNITISVADAGDEDGCELYGSNGMTISTKNGDVITQVVLTIGWSSGNAGNVTASSGTRSVSGSGNGSTYVTITDINASSVTIGTADYYVSVQVSQVQVTYESAPATYAVTANSAGDAYWSTFYTEAGNYQAPEGTQVFAVNLEGTTLTMTEISDRIVKSGEGVVLKNTTTGSITMTKTETAPAGDFSGNRLTGTMAAINTSSANDYYVLGNGSQGVGFYKLSSTGTIGANKAYLTYSGGAGAREFFPIEGNVTGIDDVRSQMSDVRGEVYDLQGRQVANPTKGLYIVNGKKVFINK